MGRGREKAGKEGEGERRDEWEGNIPRNLASHHE